MKPVTHFLSPCHTLQIDDLLERSWRVQTHENRTCRSGPWAECSRISPIKLLTGVDGETPCMSAYQNNTSSSPFCANSWPQFISEYVAVSCTCYRYTSLHTVQCSRTVRSESHNTVTKSLPAEGCNLNSLEHGDDVCVHCMRCCLVSGSQWRLEASLLVMMKFKNIPPSRLSHSKRLDSRPGGSTHAILLDVWASGLLKPCGTQECHALKNRLYLDWRLNIMRFLLLLVFCRWQYWFWLRSASRQSLMLTAVPSDRHPLHLSFLNICIHS